MRCTTKQMEQMLEEIYYEVKSLEPWSNESTKTPSTAFCLLLRLLTMRCTTKQMEQMLEHVDSPYIRCIGFLYLRYASDPKDLWDWVMPYLYDEEPVKIVDRHQGKEETVGDFVRSLLHDLDYYGTRLPRLPLGIEREMKVKLLQEEQIEERARGHEADRRRMDYFQKVGSKVRALYGDEENPVTWYDAVVDRVVWRDDETGVNYTRPKFVVTFPEYGNTEQVSLGEMDMPGGSDNYSKHRQHGRENDRDRRDREYHGKRGRNDRDHWNDRRRSRSRSRDRFPPTYPHAASASNQNDLMEEVKRREQEKVFAKGRSYASRPTSFKQSMGESSRNKNDSYYEESGKNGSKRDGHNLDDMNRTQEPHTEKSSPRQKSAQELAAIKEKKRKLMAKYG
eukprot:CAMPEP_0203683246 /NCGR_PEP_ID=MMETSP0090-20130426/47421_1 /ASSEMBLY_ACC=CAM_ASM_001088 /TAXON_ID=426623 /ORGANISM="Chaetoceros affinis, Strain CCMP159" /LENGTH=393 /DNA_ID=CAMNT_0050552381 /DNA_START=551 /DNA_END=1732 /DNA_ORIENTATION=+